MYIYEYAYKHICAALEDSHKLRILSFNLEDLYTLKTNALAQQQKQFATIFCEL